MLLAKRRAAQMEANALHGLNSASVYLHQKQTNMITWVTLLSAIENESDIRWDNLLISKMLSRCSTKMCKNVLASKPSMYRPKFKMKVHSWGVWGYPPTRTGMGYPPLGLGYPPPPGQNSRASTKCWVVCLVWFPTEDILVLP